ncbi:MAG: tRNA (adenosine(37)-N6)-threonylcarbamoyltransferase complex ATPase subunit type 1 TsaE [Bdellovibrionales bacterium]|nr:tRNA (adenosine(37)-N6)-threonylcarbamoyltransferase complex ATPase subunit type 1 TsaE [Bdellovibrionales bacterium]
MNKLKGQRRVLLLLSGDLGVGKTKTVEVLLGELGVTQVSSPTYAIHHNYEVKGMNIDHFDLYRIESESDLESTGFWDVFMQPEAWVIVEWADRLQQTKFSPQWVRVEINIELTEQGRIFKTQFC